MNYYKANRIDTLAKEYAQDVVAHINLGNERGIALPVAKSIHDYWVLSELVQKYVDEITCDHIIDVEHHITWSIR